MTYEIQNFEWVDHDLAVGFIVIDGKNWKVTVEPGEDKE